MKWAGGQSRRCSPGLSVGKRKARGLWVCKGCGASDLRPHEGRAWALARSGRCRACCDRDEHRRVGVGGRKRSRWTDTTGEKKNTVREAVGVLGARTVVPALGRVVEVLRAGSATSTRCFVYDLRNLERKPGPERRLHVRPGVGMYLGSGASAASELWTRSGGSFVAQRMGEAWPEFAAIRQRGTGTGRGGRAKASGQQAVAQTMPLNRYASRKKAPRRAKPAGGWAAFLVVRVVEFGVFAIEAADIDIHVACVG